MDDIARLAAELEPQMIEWRREFHRHPEVSYQEVWTAARIQAEVAKLGLAYTTFDGSTSFAATLEGAKPGKTIALRADFDGLPVAEETGLPFASENPGVMHACGHDTHIAMLLGAATILKRLQPTLAGRVQLCFQSAEEVGGGATELVDWLKAQGGADRVAGLHIWSLEPTGSIKLAVGPVMSGLFAFKITVTGEGGHGSRPDMVRDPIKAACDLVLKLSAIPVNHYDALDHSVVHIGHIQSGTAPNVFPDSAEITGGVRFFQPEGPDKVKEAIERICRGAELAYRVAVAVDYSPIVAPVVGHAAAVAEAKEVVGRVAGLEVSATVEPQMGSDNYSQFTAAFPGFYGFLGAARPDGVPRLHHSSRFDIDESALRPGAEFLARYAAEFLAG
jgi:amidohydrolase